MLGASGREYVEWSQVWRKEEEGNTQIQLLWESRTFERKLLEEARRWQWLYQIRRGQC
jgi:hypothetical protein